MAITKPRNDFQKIVDRYLLLLSIRKSEDIGWIGATKIQKIVFYTEYLMNLAKQRAFSLLFRRHNFGPYSDDLDKDINELASVDYISVDEKGSMHLGKLGIRILNDINDLAKEWPWVTKKITTSSNKIGPMTTDETLKFIYALPVKSVHGKTVGDIPDGGTICRPLEIQKAKRTIEIEKDWIETLSILLDISTVSNLYKIIDESDISPLTPFIID